MEEMRVKFEALFHSVYGNQFRLIRTYLGYHDEFVNTCFMFWQEGMEA